MKQVLEVYPEFHTNLAAYAILRDSILIQSMTDFETVKNFAKQYPILVHSAEFVTKTIREHLTANKPNLVQNVQPAEDSLSDSSSSESDSPAVGVASNQRSGDIRQISRDQLSQALFLAGNASSNSLSNIAQRNQTQSTGSGPSTSSAPSTVPSATQSSSGNLISNSMFSNALSQALNATGSSASPQSTSTQPSPAPSAGGQNSSSSNDNLAERYATELQTMREMGLFEELMNIQALVVSNGDVEAAINLVLSGLVSFN